MNERPDACPRCGYVLDQPPTPLTPPAPPAPPAAAIPPPAPPTSWAPVPATELPRYPAAAPAPRPRSGVRAASVPKILLGLGATCLLVAAAIFLAVAWSWLGIGGRTAVLVALTAATGAGGQWLAHRGLRGSAEALTTVALGLLVLDLAGAQDAGWLGGLTAGGFAVLVGGAVLATSLAMLVPAHRLVVPQLTAPLGLGWLAIGVGLTSDRVQLPLALVVVGCAALGVLSRRIRAAVLPWSSAVLGVWCQVVLVLVAVLDAAQEPSLHGLWVAGHGHWLLVSALLVLLPWAVAPTEDGLRRVVCSASAVLLTAAAAFPVVDEGPAALTLAAAAATVLWAAVSAAASPRWRVVTLVPLGGALLTLIPVPLVLAAQGISNLFLVADPFTASATVRLHPATAYADPWLLPLATAAVVLAGLLTLPRAARFAGAAVTLVGLGVVLTAAQHALPLWVFVGGCALGGALLLGDALRDTVPTRTVQAAAAAGVVLLGTQLALPSAVLTTVLLAEVVLGATAVLLRRFEAAAPLAGLVLPLATACLVWTTGHLAGSPLEHRSLAVVAAAGLLALVLPRVEVEVAALGSAAVASVAGVAAAGDPSVSAAVHLTVAGALVTASALVHRHRRPLAWLGSVLLLLATWVRLADLGVSQPEPYTLPAAAALVLVGLVRLRQDPATDTLPMLGAGLSLATVPSLLWVLDDPVSTRAVLLGLGSLVLLLGGAALRWTAPVLVGAAVGGLLVLRELAPYAAQTPQWVLIGAAGTLLVAVGVTWEGRLRDVQGAAAYLARLR